MLSRPATVFALAGGLLASPAPVAAQRSPHREMAVTFDDLPVATRMLHGDSAQRAITGALLDAIARHKVAAIGFVNEVKLARSGMVDPRRVALLRRWLEAGLELGNHTYSHIDLHRTSVTTYIHEIARGDSVTSLLLRERGRQPRYFRHPLLHTGRDLASRDAVDRFLAEHGYRVAPVTVDNYDYIFAAVYEHALTRGDGDGRRRIATAYLEYMEHVVAYYEQQSAALFGREIPQVLLLHASALNAETFDSLAGMLERRGYRFVTLDRALRDPAYQSDDRYTGPAGITWLHRWALTQGKGRTFFTGEPAVPESIAKEAAAIGVR